MQKPRRLIADGRAKGLFADYSTMLMIMILAYN